MLMESCSSHDLIMPCVQALTAFLAETEYQNPTDGSKCAFQKAHKTDLAPFLWVQDKPAYRDNFALWIGACREGQKNFLDVFPFETKVAPNTRPDRPIFVDIGGGIGHQCLAFKSRYPDSPGRVILQDLPAVIAQAIPIQGVEAMAHDFMVEQPVKGKLSTKRLLEH